MDLLDFVIEKHGGLDRLRSVNQIIIEVKTGGWALPLRLVTLVRIKISQVKVTYGDEKS